MSGAMNKKSQEARGGPWRGTQGHGPRGNGSRRTAESKLNFERPTATVVQKPPLA